MSPKYLSDLCHCEPEETHYSEGTKQDLVLKDKLEFGGPEVRYPSTIFGEDLS